MVHLDENRGHLRAMNEKYSSKVKLTDPGLLGIVLIASEHDEISIEEMIDEFEIERLDDILPDHWIIDTNRVTWNNKIVWYLNLYSQWEIDNLQ